jgi:hypothetical protein
MVVRAKHPGMIEVRRLSKLPGGLNADLHFEMKRPELFAKDSTAFAFHAPENSVFITAANTIMFASDRRDPVVNDTALIELKDGRCCIRRIHAVEVDQFIVLEVKYNMTDGVYSLDCETYPVKFSEIEAISVIMMGTVL